MRRIGDAWTKRPPAADEAGASGRERIPRLDASGRSRDSRTRTHAHRDSLAWRDTAIADLAWADTVLLGMPVYDFGPLAALEAWVDRIARPRVTFRYTPDGPVGLLEGKRAGRLRLRGHRPRQRDRPGVGLARARARLRRIGEVTFVRAFEEVERVAPARAGRG